MRIILVGMPACGKTGTASVLADLLHYKHIDTDREVEQLAGMSVEEIFSRKGEVSFRNLERDILNQLIDNQDIVVSSGGGLPCFEENMETINKYFFSVYLRCPKEELVCRLLSEEAENNRPLLRQEGEKKMQIIHGLFEERTPVYERADVYIDTEANPKETAEKICRYLQKDKNREFFIFKQG